MFYFIFKQLCKVILRVFFREYKVEGLEQVPEDKPVLIVANHSNALVDPLVIMILLKRRLTLTGKNLLKKDPFLKILIGALDIVMFHRTQDVGKGAELRENIKSIARCVDILGEGGAVCIFPEGESHSDPGMRPFKNGAAKIALDYQKKYKDKGDLLIVPVGLNYTEKDRFRSGIWLRFGRAFSINQWTSLYSGPNSEKASALTNELENRISETILNLETEEQSVLLNWTAKIMLGNETGPKELGTVGAAPDQVFSLKRTLFTGYKQLSLQMSEEIRKLEEAVIRYKKRLTQLRISPDEVYMEYPVSRVLLFILRELEIVLIGSPLALWGMLNHFLPYNTVALVARKLSTDLDHWATNKIYPSMVIYPFFYLIQSTAVYLTFGPLWTLFYIILLPYSGFYALLYLERISDCMERIKTFFKLYFDNRLQKELVQEGNAIVSKISELGDYLQANRLGG